MAISADAIRSVIASEAGIDQAKLGEGATLADLDISSLDVASIVFELEDRLGIEIDPDRISPDFTIADFVTHVQGLERS